MYRNWLFKMKVDRFNLLLLESRENEIFVELIYRHTRPSMASKEYFLNSLEPHCAAMQADRYSHRADYAVHVPNCAKLCLQTSDKILDQIMLSSALT